MHPENGDWILVQGSDPESLRAAIVEHSELAGYEQPTTHRVSLVRVDSGQLGVRFEPKLPPDAFVNLIGWLDDPQFTAGVSWAAGWLTSPGTGVRYFLTPRDPNAGGDTLIGLGDDGTPVTVYLPDGGLRRSSVRVEPLPEPPLGPITPLLEFEIEAESDPSFGNPSFVGDRMVLYGGGKIATLAQIEHAIRGLDGTDITEAMSTDEKGQIILHIAGGGGHYLLSLTWPDRVLNLYGPDPEASELVSFVAAGQRVEVPRWAVADLKSTLRAAEHFARTGEPDPALRWYPA